MDIFLSFVLAFLVCGLLSALFQAFMMLTKLKPPRVLVIGFALGALFVPLGLMGQLEVLGEAGMSITVMGAGGAACGTLLEMLAGNATPFITVMLVFVSLAVIGIIAGIIRSMVTKSKDNESSLPK